MKPDRLDPQSLPLGRLVVLGLAVGLVAVTSVGIVAASQDVIGSPDLSLSVKDNHFEPNQAGKLRVQITNSGTLVQGGLAQYEQRVQTARNVRFEIQAEQIDAPIEVKSGPAVVGNLPPGAATVVFDIEVGNAEPGRYRIPVEVSYDHTLHVEYESGGREPEYRDSDDTETKYVEIVVDDDAQFEVVTESTQNLYAGDTGRLRATIKNTGTEPARDATVHLTPGTEGLFFGSFTTPQRSTSVFLDSLDPGETRQFSVAIGASSDLTEGTYPVTATVNYDNVNGIPSRSSDLPIGVSVGPERTFVVRNVTTSGLQVGQTGARITGEIVNTGPTPVSDAVVRLNATGPVTATGPEAAVGDLAPGESQPVTFTLDVSKQAEPGSHSLLVVTEYENADGDTRVSDAIRQQVEIGRELTFSVTNLSTDDLRVGENDVQVTGTIVNTGSTTARNAVVTLRTSSGVRVPGPESAVGNLAPGESRQVSFTLAVPENAEPGSHSIRFAVEYETEDGDVLGNVTPIRQSLSVGPEQDTFEIVGVETDLATGDSSTVAVRIKHTGSEPISNVEARAFVSDPLSSSDNDAFLGQMEPGETATAVFKMSATEDAIPKNYAASVEVRYEEADGDSRLADGMSAGIPVADGDGGLPLPFIALGGTLVVAGGAMTAYRRRRA